MAATDSVAAVASSPVQLAQAVDSTRVISRLKTVAEHPTVPLLVALAQVLKVSTSTDELFGLKPTPRLDVPRQPPEERRLMKKLRQVAALPERDQRAVLRLISSVASAGVRHAS